MDIEKPQGNFLSFSARNSVAFKPFSDQLRLRPRKLMVWFESLFLGLNLVYYMTSFSFKDDQSLEGSSFLLRGVRPTHDLKLSRLNPQPKTQPNLAAGPNTITRPKPLGHAIH